jgi:hypothetical protein
MPRFPRDARRVVISLIALAALWSTTAVPPVHAGGPFSQLDGLATPIIDRRPGEASEVVARS